jgi:S1-C subfamily serine protease
MRAVAALAVALVACGPKVSPRPVSFDEDLGGATEPATPTEPAAAVDRPIAPPGKGLRSGTIPRDRLVAILNAGPGQFLRQLEVVAKMSGERFVGWELVQLVDRQSPLFDVDVVPGDVLLAVNGRPVSRPDQLQTVWDSLRTANEVSAQLWRCDAQLTLAFAIEPKL